MPGQYRGWFNALMWASIALTDRSPFKSVLGYETLKDEKGEEMHKSKGNAIWFDEAVEKIGADIMRLLYCLQNPAQELRFGFNVAKEPKNNLSILYNISKLIRRTNKPGKYFIEDKWIISKFNSLIKKATDDLENLHPHNASRELQNFWLSDLSRGYIQLVRDRLANDDEAVNNVLIEAYTGLIKMCAPIVPFVTEKIWQELRAKKTVKKESVHLSDWPKFNEKKINKNLEKQFKIAFEIIERGLAERDKAQIGLKWPLSKVILKVPKEINLNVEMKEIIMRQLNVKNIGLEISNEINVELDTKLTPELEAEGHAREFARHIQAARKNAGLKKGDLVDIEIVTDDYMKKVIEDNIKFLNERTHTRKIKFATGLDKKTFEFEIKGRKVTIHFCNY